MSVALASASTNLLITAISFYTVHRFGWNLRQNFLLATGQGFFYVGGALLAHPISERVGRRVAVGWVYVAMGILALAAFILRTHPAFVTAMLLLYCFVSTIGWPMIESLVSTDVDSATLSRRVGMYNLVWSALGVVMLAIDGTLIANWPAGIFLLPVMFHGISAIIMLARPTHGKNRAGKRESFPASVPEVVASIPVSHLSPEPELLRVRTLALWLSRVALPATYVVIFSLMALMPLLPVVKQLPTSAQTLVGGTWMTTRLLAFVVLGLTTWWHTRPRLLALAAAVMLVSFVGVTVRPSDILGHGSTAIDLTAMLAAQLALGAALGMIYSASLYFGMVLSDGSTEHGGYHEALIGIGCILGSSSGALAQTLRPGQAYAGVIAVGSVIFISVLAVGVTAIIGNRRRADIGLPAAPSKSFTQSADNI
ncbi:MAG TPA: MFS transporter [Tepidisphaeraceae bacterium]|nr:MFS transporter [Tepidisphaeraceae bacterium]